MRNDDLFRPFITGLGREQHTLAWAAENIGAIKRDALAELLRKANDHVASLDDTVRSLRHDFERAEQMAHANSKRADEAEKRVNGLEASLRSMTQQRDRLQAALPDAEPDNPR